MGLCCQYVVQALTCLFPLSLEAKVPEPDTSGDKELARKLFVELSHDHLGIPGNGALVILDGLDDDVSAKTEQQLAPMKALVVALSTPRERSPQTATMTARPVMPPTSRMLALLPTAPHNQISVFDYCCMLG